MQELQNYVPKRSRADLIESKGTNIIISALNLLETIDNEYPPEEADALKKRFMLSLKTGEPARFSSSMKKVK